MTVETSDIRVGGISESLRRALFTRDGRQRTGRTVFFTALVLYGVAYCFSTSSLVFDYGNVYKITRTLMDVALAIAALKIVFFTPYRQTEKLLMFLPVVAAAAALVTSGFYQLLDLMVFVVASASWSSSRSQHSASPVGVRMVSRTTRVSFAIAVGSGDGPIAEP